MKLAIRFLSNFFFTTILKKENKLTKILNKITEKIFGEICIKINKKKLSTFSSNQKIKYSNIENIIDNHLKKRINQMH